MAVGISRYASLLEGIRGGYLEDSDFFKIVERDLIDGQHRNPTDKRQYFMDSFFHHPDELMEEISGSGFLEIKIIGIEGPCWLIKNNSILWSDSETKNKLLFIVRQLEAEKYLLGVNSHFMAIGKKKYMPKSPLG